MTPRQIELLEQFESSDVYTPLEKDVLRFAVEWTRQGRAPKAVVERLGGSLSEAELVGLAATVAQANWTNRFCTTFEIEFP